MTRKLLITLLVVVGMVVPAAAAPMVSQPNDVAAPGSSTSPPVADAAPLAQSEEGDESDESGNYTRIYVEDDYRHLELKPGESRSLTVAVENGEEREIELDPHVYVPEVGERPVKESWVSIEGDATLGVDEESEFNITISVPESAELGRYNGIVAFTDETVTYPGRPPRPVTAAQFSLEVWKEPTVHVLAGRYSHRQIEAGETATHTIIVENTGDSAVPLNPQLKTERQRYRPMRHRNSLDRSWITIDAPNQVGPGETETVNVTISPPASADRGDYDAELDLGLKDPARPERDTYWQEINLGFQVWKQPSQPFVTNFTVAENAESVTLTLNADGRPRGSDSEDASFDVTFVAPDGSTVEATPESVADNGYVDLGGEQRPGPYASSGPYNSHSGDREVTYALENPQSGEWSVRIMPENTMRFRYDIVRERGGN